MCWRREKNKKRIGVHAFSAVLQLHRRRFKGASVFCLAVVKKKKKKIKANERVLTLEGI